MNFIVKIVSLACAAKKSPHHFSEAIISWKIKDFNLVALGIFFLVDIKELQAFFFACFLDNGRPV